MRFDRPNWAVRRGLAGLVAAGALVAATRVHGAPVAPDDGIDDPKLARRLGSRMDWVTPPASPTAAPAPAAPLPETSIPVVPAADRAVPVVPPPATAPAMGISAPAPAAEAAFEPVLPRAELAFHRFDFVRIGTSGLAGLAQSEAFDSLSLDVYPVSSLIRVGLSTAYGWQAGMTSGGDYFATETASLGAQVNLGRVVPFAEGLAGVGYMRRLQFDHTIPTVFWQLGIDLGASVYLARVGFVSIALGYLHPVNGFLKMTSFESVYTNTWSFKIGIGI